MILSNDWRAFIESLNSDALIRCDHEFEAGLLGCGKQIAIREFSPTSFVGGFDLMVGDFRSGAGVLWSKMIRIPWSGAHGLGQAVGRVFQDEFDLLTRHAGETIRGTRSRWLRLRGC
jgi:hypothetical protein